MLRTLITLSLTLVAGLAVAEDAKPADVTATPYPLDTCIVSGEKLGGMGEPVVKVVDGREVKFCCNGCIKKFTKDPAKFFAALDATVKEAAAKPVDAKPAAEEKHEKKGDGHEGHAH